MISGFGYALAGREGGVELVPSGQAFEKLQSRGLDVFDIEGARQVMVDR